MRSWLLAAGLLAAAAASPAYMSPARAADIDGVPPPPRNGPYGGYYDDPRYAPKAPPQYYDEEDDDGPYGTPPAKRYTYTPPPSYGAPPPPPHYGAPPPPPHYGAPPPRPGYGPPPASKYAGPPPGKSCVRSEHVRDRLTSEGWRDFHDGKPINDGLVTLRARRPNGRLFELTLHRCSGEVVEARPLQLRPFGPYAYRQPYGPYGPWGWAPQPAPHSYQNDDSWEERYAYRGPRRWQND
jgi:hypothetical protein